MKGHIVGTFGISETSPRSSRCKSLGAPDKELRLRNKELDERNDEIQRLNVNLNHLVDHDGLTAYTTEDFLMLF